MSKWLKITAISFVFVFSITGCKKYEPVPAPSAKLNAKPVERYRLLLTIPEPPGLLRVTGKATYTIENNGYCVPLDKRRSLGGSHPSFSNEISLPVRKISDRQYEIYFYADAYNNEDYYGKGICKWRGVPAYRIHWSGASYAVVNNTKTELGIVVRKACSAVPSHSVETCADEEYASNFKNGAYFLATLVTYKD